MSEIQKAIEARTASQIGALVIKTIALGVQVESLNAENAALKAEIEKSKQTTDK